MTPALLLTQLRRAVVVSVFFALALGLAYPLVETGIAQAVFPYQANGSLTANGSMLIGQQWKGPGWFHGRPDPENPMSTGGTNLGPRSKQLKTAVAAQIAADRKQGITPTPDLVTGSGSGIDPDITPAAAYGQVHAVAAARHLPAATVRHLVAANLHGASLGFLGAPYVDVLQLNDALVRLR